MSEAGQRAIKTEKIGFDPEESNSLRKLPLHKIFVPPVRLRPIDGENVQRIAELIERYGLLQPIAVSATPNGEAPYTLVDGAHRFLAVRGLGHETINANIVRLGGAETALLEMMANTGRKELTTLETGEHITTYRGIWEKANGPIERGGDRRSATARTGSPEKSQAERFYEDAERMFGRKRDAIEKALKIGGMATELREALRGTPAENNQAHLLKLAKLPERQVAFAGVVKAHGFETAWAALKPPKAAADERALSAFISAWTRMSADMRGKALAKIGVGPP